MRAELHIRGPIGADAVSDAYVRDFVGAAKAVGYDSVAVCIDSTGGDVAEALAIVATLRESGLSTTSLVEGVCESSATLIAFACGRVLARPFATFLLHEPTHSQPGGKLHELEAKTARLRQAREAFLAAYVQRTGLPR